MGLFVGSVCVTMYTAAPEVTFEQKLNSVGVRTFRHYKIPGYPNDVARIVSDEGYGKNDYIETERPLVVITAPASAAVRWRPACPSCTMSISGGQAGMPSSRLFPSEPAACHMRGPPPPT